MDSLQDPMWPLWGLVTGIPEPQRSNGLLLMLQALIDESQSYDAPRLFVMGGYIATVERWAGLTRYWKEALDASPRIDYFAYAEAFPRNGKPRGQFNNFTIQERDLKVSLFRYLIEHFALAEIGIGFELASYGNAFAGIEDLQKHPYRFAFSCFKFHVARSLEVLGLPRGPLQFIYDERKIDKAMLMDAWWHAKSQGNPSPPDIYETVLTTDPSFRSSSGRPDSVIALQAADMFAGWTRACNETEMQGGIPLPLPGTKRRLDGLFVTFTDEMLQEAADRIRSRNQATIS